MFLINQKQKFCFVSSTLKNKNVICKYIALTVSIRFGNFQRKSTVIFSYDGENFTSGGSSRYSHYVISAFGLANYMGKALITGCFASWEEDQGCGTKTEIMDMSTLQWSNGPSYPFAST